MRVLFDARPAASNTGIARYAATMAGVLRSGVPGHECYLLGGPNPDLALKATSPIEEALELPAVLQRESVDVFHSSLFHLPPILPWDTRSVVTLHDAIPVVRPDLCSSTFAREFEQAREALTRADRVVCPSESAKSDTAEHLGVASDRLVVLPETPAACFRVLEPAVTSPVLERLNVHEPYVLFVGSLERRKNPAALLDALALLGDEAPRAVFAGPEAGFDLPAEASRRGVSDRVVAVGYVADDDLVALYCRASALVSPSLYEGFGLPVLEAFACGTPVIASCVASLPEVASDAALLVALEHPEEIAEAIKRVASPDLRADLCAKGRRRLEHFSVERVRAGLAELYTALERAAAEATP